MTSIPRAKRRPAPEWTIVKAFAVAIVAGALALALPFSRRDGGWTDPVTALFTAASATCVTGLTVVSTGGFFSAFGQMVILGLIQLGGLGIMTLGTFFLVVVGRRLRMQDEFVLMDSFGTGRVVGLRPLLARTVVFTLVIETAGAILIGHRFAGTARAGEWNPAAFGVFHSVSAFCNAGFCLFDESLAAVRDDPAIVCSVAALIVLGGLGFLVLYDLSSLRPWRRSRLARGRLTLHSRVVLAATAVLIGAGWLFFLTMERGGTWALLGARDRVVAALFHAVTPRTAGFQVVDVRELSPSGLFFTIGLMFIGGAPGSTAGGVKVTTLVVLAVTVIAMVRGRQETVCAGRSLSRMIVREALVIFLLGITCVAVFFQLLLLTEHAGVLARGEAGAVDLLFETVSAFGTVGLSTGVTASLSTPGKLVIILCMFVGRLGPLTLAVMVGRQEVREVVRYPEEPIVVG